MNREDALMEARYAKYLTIDSTGITRVFVSLREIQSAYGVNYTTVSKCLKDEEAGICSVNRSGDWLVVRSLNPPA